MSSTAGVSCATQSSGCDFTPACHLQCSGLQNAWTSLSLHDGWEPDSAETCPARHKITSLQIVYWWLSSANFPSQRSHYRAAVMLQPLLDIWQLRTLQRLWQKSRRSHVISVDLSKQSALLCCGSEARTQSAHTAARIDCSAWSYSTCALLLCLPLCTSLSFHFPHPSPVVLSSAFLSFCFITRSALVVQAGMHPAPVSLRARECACCIHAAPASPWVKLDEMCFA